MAARTSYPGLDTANANTIVLRGDLHRFHDEARANGAIKPGHRIMKTTDTPAKVVVSTTAGQKGGPLMFAKEDALQGNDITTAYAAGDVVPYHIARPGDRIQVRVPASAVAITKHDMLMDNGDGCFVKVQPTGLLYKSAAASTAISGTAAITAYSLSYTLPANSLQAGDILRIRGSGTITTATGAETFLCTVKLGSVVICLTPADYDPVTNDIFLFDIDVTIRTIGTSGTFVAAGQTYTGTPAVVGGAADETSAYTTGTTAQAINTTTTNAITVSQTCSNTGETSKLESLSVELIRGGSTGAANATPLLEAEATLDNSAGVTEAFLIATVI